MSQHESPAELTTLLNAWTAGDTAARDRLFESVYPQIKAIAQRHRGPRGEITLQPTEIVHEAYLRLTHQKLFGWRHRAQFFKLASQLVRQVLVDHARARNAVKRGSRDERSDMDADELADIGPAVDLLSLHEALTRLAEIDSEAARIVELRYFGGLTIPETAEVLETGTATVSRRWQVARAWLRRELDGTAADALSFAGAQP